MRVNILLLQASTEQTQTTFRNCGWDSHSPQPQLQFCSFAAQGISETVDVTQSTEIAYFIKKVFLDEVGS